MSNTKMTTIFNQKLCGYLMMRGFVLISMTKNDFCPGKNVFFFNDTDALQEAIKDFTHNSPVTGNTKFVYKVNIARKLLKMGYHIVDWRPSKDRDGKTDFLKSIYVFADENGIDDVIQELTAQ